MGDVIEINGREYSKAEVQLFLPLIVKGGLYVFLLIGTVRRIEGEFSDFKEELKGIRTLSILLILSKAFLKIGFL